MSINDEPLDISYNREQHIVTIDGINFTEDFFRAFTMPELNAVYQFERDGDAVTVTKYRVPDEMLTEIRKRNQ